MSSQNKHKASEKSHEESKTKKQRVVSDDELFQKLLTQSPATVHEICLHLALKMATEQLQQYQQSFQRVRGLVQPILEPHVGDYVKVISGEYIDLECTVQPHREDIPMKPRHALLFRILPPLDNLKWMQVPFENLQIIDTDRLIKDNMNRLTQLLKEVEPKVRIEEV